jgi:hypothetical protein
VGAGPDLQSWKNRCAGTYKCAISNIDFPTDSSARRNMDALTDNTVVID